MTGITFGDCVSKIKLSKNLTIRNPKASTVRYVLRSNVDENALATAKNPITKLLAQIQLFKHYKEYLKH